ncbi:NEK1 [Symbiodinium sp. CCMP2592]|nr:NEK1 [Symbiodinium sp. CCMP2592]
MVAGQYGTAYLVSWDEEKCGEERKGQYKDGDQAVAKVVGLEFLPEKEHNFAFQEVELMRALRHPHIVALRDHFLTEASLELVIVMEFCDSGDLRGEVKRRTQAKPPNLLPEATIMTWFVQMTLALNYMHQRHILHRDLKSSNVFLTTAPSGNGDYDVRIGDFGISRVLEGTVDVAATVVGTPYYMSPEACRQIHGDPKNHSILLPDILAQHEINKCFILGTFAGVPAGATLAVGDAAVSCRTPCGLYRRLRLETTGTYQLQEPQGAGCLCGAVRLRLQEPPIRLMHCHCSMCRRQGGGAFMTWAAYPDLAIEVLQGRRALRRFNSSDFASRTFCPKCGSTIALNYHGQLGTTWLAAGMIDGDIGCCPDSHIMLNYKAPWFDLTEHVLHRPKAAPKPPVKSSMENLKRVEPEPVQPIIEDQPVRREWHAPPFVSTPAPQHTLAEGELRVRVLLSRVRRGLSARRQNWLQVFASFDRKGDGQLKEAEFERAVTSMALGLSDQEIREAPMNMRPQCRICCRQLWAACLTSRERHVLVPHAAPFIASRPAAHAGAAIWFDMFDFEAMEVNGAVGQATRRGAEDVDKDGNTALHRLLAAASQSGSETATDPVRRMLSARADVNVSNALGETPLLSLLRASGDLNSTRALCTILLRARADPNCSDSITGESALMEAACLGDRSLCLLLLQAQADISQCNSNGQQASDVAIAAGHSELAQLLAKGTGADERNDPAAAELGIRSSPREQQDLPQDPGATAESSVPPQRPKGRPRGRGALSGAMQKRCEEHGVPLDVLGLVASSELLKEIDRWQTLTEAELASEWEAHGMETETESMRPRDELEARLKQLRLWRLLPMEALQDACRREAGHLVTADEGPLSRQELVEALQVATWGGLTRLQRTRKRCAEKGIPDKKLENRERAEHILQEFEKLENMKEADLIRQYKGKGFAHDADLSQDELLSALKEYVLFQEMSLSHLRQICKEKNLAIRGEHRRTELIALVTADSWQRFQIPVLKMPSTLVAQGLLDQVQRFQKKELPQLRHECRKRNLPAESHPRKQDLINRLRNHLVWSQMTTDGLREECQAREVKFQTVQVASNASHMLKMHAERAEKKEMIDALHSWLVTEMLELKGIPVKTVGHEVGLGIFTEVERYESMPASLLQAEYATLGMPSEPNLDDKELLRRLKQVLIWSQLSVDELVKECEARELSSGGFPNRPSEADKIQVLMDRLILSLGVDGWEKQGIPVYRLTSLEAAIVIVEELGRLEAAKQADVSAAYRLLGLPPEALDKAAMISRLKHYLVWQELRPAELRKECLKHGISALGDPEELIALLVLKNWGVLPEDWEAPDPPDWSRFEPPPRRQSPAPAPPSAKVAAAFREWLGWDWSCQQAMNRFGRHIASWLYNTTRTKILDCIKTRHFTGHSMPSPAGIRNAVISEPWDWQPELELQKRQRQEAAAWPKRVEDWAKLLLNELAQKAMTEDDAEISIDDTFVIFLGPKLETCILELRCEFTAGLQSAMGAKLNGCEGIVETWNAATCRWNVRIAGVGVKSIRDEHLEQLNPGAFGAPKMPASSTGTDTIAIYRLLCKDGVTAVHESDFQAVVQRLLPQSEEQHKKLLWLLPKCPDGKVDVPEALSQLEKGFDQTTQPGATLAGGVGRAPVAAGGPPVPLVPGPLNPAQGRPRNTGLRGPGGLPSPMAPNPTSCSSKLRTRVFCQPPPCWIAFSAFSWAQALGRTNQLS